MKKPKPTVTVAVSAYNEGQNIKAFLESVIGQKEDGFKIEGVWVHDDGSTDNTVELVKSLKSPRIKLWEHKKRVGKSTRLNQIYTELTTDFLVQTDADVIFAHQYVVRDIIQPLIKNPDRGMCGGNPEPLSGKSFWEKVAKVAFEPYQEFRSEVRGGDNAFSAVGQILSYRKELVKKIFIPEDMVTNDIYTYFCCLSRGFGYKFVKTAKVYYRAPRKLSDLIKQNTRFQVGYHRMFDLFDSQLVAREFSIPKKELYLKLGKQFLKYPIHSLIYYLLNILCRLSSVFINSRLNAKWPIAISTKALR